MRTKLLTPRLIILLSLTLGAFLMIYFLEGNASKDKAAGQSVKQTSVSVENF